MDVEVLSVSSRGRITISKDIRKKMSISAGDKLMVYTEGENIFLKPVRSSVDEELNQEDILITKK
ncbi:MAG: AbrB/MazE/SpoVT family DNA-binding domain-containing protein [Erysipelotrichaceae bacterium]|nr:AbrB/MazE/SpoVT family DNA-binding domain-containing protein [Erysipelotrichaceae bacterium]